ncbi:MULTISPECIES: hypothetical protein [Sphingomonadaceae]|uniref:hypothetical protein n=1 Tax=Sphingomonadales TaxID=204457 RepID=UPI000770622A|nr:hypothetical protein [Sphingobium sp. TKS]AMK23240.1 hypothetical protein K426_11520 [Sphingobium sp. TKS]MCF8709084.1 hypothetical protein [Rhizorhapis sp. SPR117]
MPELPSLELLREARGRLASHDLNDPATTQLILKIDVHLAALAPNPGSAELVEAACKEWRSFDEIDIDSDEQRVSIGEDGTWVRAWIFLSHDDAARHGVSAEICAPTDSAQTP